MKNESSGEKIVHHLEDPERNHFQIVSNYLALSKLGIWEYHVEMNRLYWSDEVYAIYQIESQSEISLESAISFYSESDKKRIQEALQSAIQEGKPDVLISKLILGDDSYKWVRINGQALIQDGKVYKVYGTIQDITIEHDALVRAKEAEARARLAEERFAGLIDTKQGWVYEVDVNQTYVFSTDKVEEILGYTAGEIMGKTPYEIIDPKHSSIIAKEVEFMIQNQLPIVDMPNWNLAKDGRRVLLLTNAIPIYDDSGQLKGYRGIDQDITHQHMMEVRAREKELLLNQVHIAKCEFYPNTNTVIWNSAVYDILEYDKSMEPSRDLFFNRVHPDDREKVEKLVQDSMMVKSELRMIHRLIFPDGRIKWVRNQLRSYSDLEENYSRTLGILQDISEIQELQDELMSQKSYLESITNSLDSSTIVSISDRKGIILRANENFCKVSGYKESELLGKNHNIVNSGYHSTEFWREMWMTISQGKSWRQEVRNQAKDGTYYWVDTTVNPIFDRFGRIIEYLSIRYLITDRKNAEFKLEEERKRLRSTLEMINREIDFAENMQNYLLPSPPNWSDFGLKIEPWFQPFDRVSGDIYDFFIMNSKRFRFFIADATGHGLTAGFQTMCIQTEYQRIKREFQEPSWVLYYLNQSIHKTFTKEPIHYTCCVVDVDLERNEIQYASAGHAEPILMQNNKVQLLHPTAPILGILDNYPVTINTIPLAEEFRLILYTDGITETYNRSLDIFDINAFIRFLQEEKEKDSKELLHNLKRTIDDFRMHQHIFDDITVLAIDKQNPIEK